MIFPGFKFCFQVGQLVPLRLGQPIYANEDAQLQSDLERMYSSTQFRFWMKVLVTVGAAHVDSP
jgi:hypothetical protein